MHLLSSLLLNSAENDYAEFSKKLIPDTELKIVGVRVPLIKKIAHSVKDDKAIIRSFICEKHSFYEEVMLHGLLLQYAFDDIESLILGIENFLPQIDNWAVCDSTVPSLKILKKYKDLTYQNAVKWLNSTSPYTVRFGVVTLMNYFLLDEYVDDVLALISSIKTPHYYVNMSISWLLSVALVKYYDKTIKLLHSKTLPHFIQNKTIQKAIESFRISNEKKVYLRKLKT